MLSLHALLPVRGVDVFRLGTSRLGRDSLDLPALPPNLFRLGISKLGTRRLYYEAALMTWQDILSPCTQIKCWRGVDATGPVRNAKAGTLTATAIDALDPRVTGLHHGTPIRLIHWPTREMIFTGSVTDMTITPHRPGERHSYTATLTAADAVADIIGITRYGAKATSANGSETWTARVKRLFASAPNHEVIITDDSYALLCATVWETSLAKHIDAAVASIGGHWIVGRSGAIRVSPHAAYANSGISFTDETPTDTDTNIWSYTVIDRAWNAASSITSITATNHGAKLESGEWRADDTEITVTDQAAKETWKGTDATVDTTLLPRDIEPLVQSLLRAAPDQPPPSAITVVPASARTPGRATLMAIAATLDPMTIAEITARRETSTGLIAAVAHEITPRTWTTNLTLTNP